MIVLFTGMTRSGSTWTFNIVKALLSARGTAAWGYRDDIAEVLATRDPAIEHLLIKTHVPDAIGLDLIAHGACRTVCTYRAPLDCIVSAMEVFGTDFAESLTLIERELGILEAQSRWDTVMFVPFGAVTERPRETVAALAGYVGCAAAPDELARIAETFSRDNVVRYVDQLRQSAAARGGGQALDRDTLLTTNHIRAQPGTPAEALSAAERRTALGRLARYVTPDGAFQPTLLARLSPLAD